MKKLLLSLAGLAIALCANAVDYYLVGGFNGWNTSSPSCKFTAQSDGNYILDYSGTLTSGFKICGGSWDDAYNYGSSNENSDLLTVGQTFNLTLGSGSKNINTVNYANIDNPHLVFNPSTKTLLITGQEQQAEVIYGIHSSWTDTNWSTTNMTEQNGKWVLANQTVPAGQFGIKSMDKSTGAQLSWISADGNGVVVLDTPMPCKNEGTNFSNAAGTYTFTFDPSAMTLTVTGTQTGETPTPTPSTDWWVNIGGSFNENNYFDGGVQPVDGIVSFSNLGIGTGTFKVKTWDGKVDKYYIAESNPIATDQWVQLIEDNSDGEGITISGATDNSVYNIKFNITNNKIYVEPVTGSNPGTAPEHVYVIGSIPGNAWNPTGSPEMTNEGDGLYTIEGVEFENGADGATMAYFALVTVQSTDWNVINANRFGPQIKDTEAVEGDNIVDGKGDLSWSIVAGKYDLTFDYNEMILTVTKVDGGNDEPVNPNPPTPGELPEVLYIIGNVNSYSWDAPINGVPAKGVDGVYTWNEVTVNDAGSGSGYFAFATIVGGGWDDTVNTGDRYGAPVENTPLKVGETGTVTLYAAGVDASASQSWMVAADTYTIQVNLNNMNISLLNGNTDGVSNVAVEAGETVYFNLQGQKVANPDKGIYIQVKNGKAVKVVK